MPLFVRSKNTPESLDIIGTPEMVPRNCALEPYKKLKKVPTFPVKGEFIAYASPDSTYAVTRRLFDQAKKEIIIGIYDFSAEYMKQLVLDAMHRGVKVSLMLDTDNIKGETEIFEELKKFGCNSVEAPSCASKVVHYFHSSHEKVIVIDGTWTLVQSGNYTDNSIPFNEKDGGDPAHFRKGNRDMGIAIKSKPLAGFFAKLLKSDMKLETDAAHAEALPGLRAAVPELVEAVPKNLPSRLFPSKTFNSDKAIDVTPVLTPDNYMDVIPAFIASAKKSVYIENQYIRSSHEEIIVLLESITKARKKNPELDVRIVLGKLFAMKDYEKEEINIANLKKEFKLSLGKNIRYINTDRFVHCHNKLIIVDEKKFLVSSQNWSNTGVSSNREAGLLIDYPQIAKYFTGIFESDWDTAFRKIPKPGKATASPEAIAAGNFVKVSLADYQEV